MIINDFAKRILKEPKDYDKNIGSEMQYLKNETDYDISVKQMKDRLSKQKYMLRLGEIDKFF